MQDQLPEPMRRELELLGVRVSKPVPPKPLPVWLPSYKGEEPPW